MESKFLSILEKPNVKEMIKRALSRNYNQDIIPMQFDNNYIFKSKYILFLIIDALFKYLIIIDDARYFDSYIRDLEIILRKMNNYPNIKKGINSIIIKYTLKIQDLKNAKNIQNKEKVLRYIYKRYIVDGYFYFGCNESNYNSLLINGIKSSGNVVDSRLEEVDYVLRKYARKCIFTRKKACITDSLVVGSYFSYLGPDYIEKLAKSNIFNNKKYDNSCFYDKNINTFRDNFIKYSKSKHISKKDEALIINNFLDVYFENKVNGSKSILAFIKRSYLNRNYLKDIEEIIKELKNLDINEAVAMVTESRYISFELENDIKPEFLEIVRLPNYNYLTGNIVKANDIELLEDDLEVLKIENFDDNKTTIKNPVKMNSYGYVTIFMFLSLICLSLGIILTFVMYGG